MLLRTKRQEKKALVDGDVAICLDLKSEDLVVDTTDSFQSLYLLYFLKKETPHSHTPRFHKNDSIRNCYFLFFLFF